MTSKFASLSAVMVYRAHTSPSSIPSNMASTRSGANVGKTVDFDGTIHGNVEPFEKLDRLVQMWLGADNRDDLSLVDTNNLGSRRVQRFCDFGNEFTDIGMFHSVVADGRLSHDLDPTS